jgi:hypothetical protein
LSRSLLSRQLEHQLSTKPPRTLASPVRGCGSPHTDRPASDSSGDGALVSFIDAIKLPLEQPLMVSPLRLHIKDPKAADDGDFIPSAAPV